MLEFTATLGRNGDSIKQVAGGLDSVMWRRSRRIASLAPAIAGGLKHSPLFLQHWRWFSAAALIIVVFSARSGLSHPQQNQVNGREDAVLQIQELIQEHNLAEARRQLSEAVAFPSWSWAL